MMHKVNNYIEEALLPETERKRDNPESFIKKFLSMGKIINLWQIR